MALAVVGNKAVGWSTNVISINNFSKFEFMTALIIHIMFLWIMTKCRFL